MPLALWSLALGAFGIGTTEFIVSGILPSIANDLNVTIPEAGGLATAYALGVFISAPILAIVSSRLSKKTILIIAMAFFISGNIITAASYSLTTAAIGRVITSLAHGAFFGTGSIVAAEMVSPGKRVQAISFMFMGLTVASLAGIPLGTWIGQNLSWREVFVLIALIGVITVFSLWFLIPYQKNYSQTKISSELKVFKNIDVLLAMGITIFGPAAFFTSITYIAPMMIELAGFHEADVSWLMFIFGVGLFVGNHFGGRYADRALMPLLYITLALQTVVLLFFGFNAHNPWLSAICIFLMAAFGFATVSPIQKLVMDKAQAAGAPTLASSMNIGFFNLGNAIGAWVGGLVIVCGLGLQSPNWAGAILSLIALILAVISGLRSKAQTIKSIE